jgi:flagellar hook protein FlgE
MTNVFSAALSSLRANETAIDATGHNLANMNTAGFKSSTVSFQEMVAETASGTASAAANGAGIGPALSVMQFTQGGIQVTGGRLDVAISGEGFFTVKDAAGTVLYSRAGNFRLDSSGTLVTMTGQKVQGWTASGGAVATGGVPSDIKVPPLTIKAPVPTTFFGLNVNLNALGVVGEASGTFSTPAQVVDSLGAKHAITVQFTKSAANTWDYEVFIPGEDLTGGTAGTPSSLATGQLVFGSDGMLTTPNLSASPIPISITGLANGAADLTVDWNLYNAAGTPQFSQYNDPSAVSSITGDGSSSSQLQQIALADGGKLMAEFSDGSKQLIALLALASFTNPDSLLSVGENNYTTSSSTGPVAYGEAGTGKRGSVTAGALESSNVDMARELTNIILFQRSYQANARIVSTADELAQEVLSLKR